ncbi:MAG: FadR/GntR family transcriptional regulator [Gaiella sp.]
MRRDGLSSRHRYRMMELGQVSNRSPWVADAPVVPPAASTGAGDLWEAIEAREVFEQSLARLAAHRRTERDRIRLDDAVARMRAAGDDPTALSAGDFAFHVVLSQAAHNRLLAERFAALHDHVQRMIALYAVAALREGSVPELVGAHQRLASAIGRGDADEAPRIIGEMMASLRDEARAARPIPVYASSTHRSAAHTKGVGA